MIRRISIPRIVTGGPAQDIRPKWAEPFFEADDAVAIETKAHILSDESSGFLIGVPFTFWYRDEDGQPRRTPLLDLPPSGVLVADRMLRGVDHGIPGMNAVSSMRKHWQGRPVRAFWMRHNTQFVCEALKHQLFEGEVEPDIMLSELYCTPVETAHERMSRIRHLLEDLRMLHTILEMDVPSARGKLAEPTSAMLSFPDDRRRAAAVRRMRTG